MLGLESFRKVVHLALRESDASGFGSGFPSRVAAGIFKTEGRDSEALRERLLSLMADVEEEGRLGGDGVEEDGLELSAEEDSDQSF